MRDSVSSHIISIRILHYCRVYLPPVPISSPSFSRSPALGFIFMENTSRSNQSSSFVSSVQSIESGGGRGRGSDMRNEGERWRGRRGGGSGGSKDKIDALGRFLTRFLRHMASELNLNMWSDGYVKVQDLLELNTKTFAQIPLRSHTVDDIREAVRKDNKQRFSLPEENGELLIHANQGHTVMIVESESLLKPILSVEAFPVCVHGAYKKNLDSILEPGLNCMKRLHVHSSCGVPTDDGIKLYVSDNRVILTGGYDGVV